jgi:perosamine synthetase
VGFGRSELSLVNDTPALLGGAPLFPAGPPDWPPHWPDVQAALAACDWGKYHGDHVPALERDLGAFFGVSAVTCASGTLAVEIALRTVGVTAGSEVILAAYEYEANFLTVLAIGAKPVLVDVHPDNWNLDPARIDEAITPATKAILCSHLHGGLVPMPVVCEIADRHNIPVVEDGAQCPGAEVAGRKVGTFGRIGTLSFGGSKLLSAGRGGAILIPDYRDQCRAESFLKRGVQHWAVLSELQACVLCPQLARLAERTDHRREFVRTMWDTIRSHGVRGLDPRYETAASARPGFYKVGFRLSEAEFGLSRDQFCRAMRAEGVAFDPGFKAVHVGRSSTRYRHAGELSHSLAASTQCVILHHPVLLGTADDADRVARAVVRTYRNADRLTHA